MNASAAVASSPFLPSSSVEDPDMKGWSKDQRAIKHATAFADDGSSITCGPCVRYGRSRVDGVIKMRHPFRLNAWESHVQSQGHKNAVALLKAKRKEEAESGKPEKQQITMVGAGFVAKKSNKAARSTKKKRSGNDDSNSPGRKSRN